MRYFLLALMVFLGGCIPNKENFSALNFVEMRWTFLKGTKKPNIGKDQKGCWYVDTCSPYPLNGNYLVTTSSIAAASSLYFNDTGKRTYVYQHYEDKKVSRVYEN